METIINFLRTYKETLLQYEKTYCLSLTNILGMKGLESLFDCLVKIGVVLTIREVRELFDFMTLLIDFNHFWSVLFLSFSVDVC